MAASESSRRISPMVTGQRVLGGLTPTAHARQLTMRTETETVPPDSKTIRY
jgi:hypothetical protein